MNVSGIRFSPYSYNKALAFKATPEEVADKFKQVDIRELDEIGNFNIETKKETADTLRKAAKLLLETHPHHSRYLADRASKTKK